MRQNLTSLGFCILLLRVLCGPANSQDNSQPSLHAVGTSKDRQINLKEIVRITDNCGKYYFKDPNDLKIAHDGSFFIADQWQFLHFSKDGKFVKDIFKRGQGPGEIFGRFDYSFYGDDIYVFQGKSFFRMDYSGNYLGALRASAKTYYELLGVTYEGLVVVERIWPEAPSSGGKLDDILRKVRLLSFDGQRERDIYTFRQKIYMAGDFHTTYGGEIEVLSEDGKRIYGFHGDDYLIEVLDVSSGQVTKRYSRPYRHVKYIEGKRLREYRTKYNAPKVEYLEDISGLVLNGNNIWVKTSERNETKGNRFDVIDEKGQFVDSFYIGKGRDILAVRGNIVYILERGEDMTCQIVIYQRTD